MAIPAVQATQTADAAGILVQQSAITAYKRDPFNPFAIARPAPSAFQKAVVMRYIDNLLEWGDQLFRRDTLESLNEATFMYAIAADILGDRPIETGESRPRPPTVSRTPRFLRATSAANS